MAVDALSRAPTLVGHRGIWRRFVPPQVREVRLDAEVDMPSMCPLNLGTVLFPTAGVNAAALTELQFCSAGRFTSALCEALKPASAFHTDAS